MNSAQTLSILLRAASLIASDDDSRDLNHVRVEPYAAHNLVRVVASDGYMLFVAECDLEESATWRAIVCMQQAPNDASGARTWGDGVPVHVAKEHVKEWAKALATGEKDYQVPVPKEEVKFAPYWQTIPEFMTIDSIIRERCVHLSSRLIERATLAFRTIALAHVAPALRMSDFKSKRLPGETKRAFEVRAKETAERFRDADRPFLAIAPSGTRLDPAIVTSPQQGCERTFVMIAPVQTDTPTWGIVEKVRSLHSPFMPR